jgi:hypothetical protein
VSDKEDGIWIQSTRGPDDEPVCELTWGPLQWYAPVEDVRATALDLVACAAYAEMMMTMVVRVGVPPEMVSRFATDVLAGHGRTQFGRDSTISALPAGSSKRKQAMVLLRRGRQRGHLHPDEARDLALQWLAVAEATESDQLVSEALGATGFADGAQEKVFGYLRELRAGKGASS